MRKLLSGIVLLTLTLPAPAQRVPATLNHFRLKVLDHVVVDAKGVRKPAHLTDSMLGFVAVYLPGRSNLCFVELVAQKDSDFAQLRADAANDPQIKIFDNRSKREDVEAAAKGAGFNQLDLDKFWVRVK